MLMLAPRVYFAMARDGLFPAAAAAVHPRFGTPARAIGAQALLASVLVLFGTFDSIVAYFIFVTVAFIGLTVAAVFVLHRRDAAWREPGHPWPALIFLCMVGGLLVLLALNNPLQAALGVAVVALGVPVYRARSIAALDPVTDGDSLMTWIRTIPFDSDETLRNAREAQQALYPIEYAEPTHPHHRDIDGIVGRTPLSRTRCITRSRRSAP